MLFPDGHDPAHCAFVLEPSGVRVSYGELIDRSRRVARVLRQLGCQPRDPVAMMMENNEHFLVCAWAAQRSGLRYTAASSRLTPDEIAYILGDCEAKVVLASRATAEIVRRAIEDTPHAPVCLCVDGTSEGFSDLRTIDAPSAPLPDEAEGVDMLYSSGTTGRPKGIAAEINLDPLGTPPGIVMMMQELWKIDADAVYLSPAPLYHAAPLRFCMAMHRVGATCVVMERFDAVALLELIERHRVTHTQLVPAMMVRILKLPPEERERFDLRSLRCVIHAAAACPAEIKRGWIEWLGPIVYEYYSATENHMLTTISSEEALARPGSVGRPLLGMPHVLDEEGRELPVGEVGTIWAEGGREFVYHNDPEETAESRNPQGYRTVGDLGYVDADGYVYLSDRRADLVICGGVNVYPREAEDRLLLHPKVIDAAVFGIPDEELGQVVHAVVQPAAGERGPDLEAELLDFLGEKLARFKLPRAIDFRDELPRHPTGKLYKRLLRDEYAR
ncbi:MAG TPA: AMP-binding protein [Solirubrobacteraceae bacterium]|jgi:fatty-acyl-CoA synthase|nr:AMP-binding protein [Solirubrobacteraceae bacterium]